MDIGGERLRVRIEEPWTTYRRTRFDACGFVTAVTLDGVHQFCVTEADCGGAHNSNGAGLCNEFGILKPIGFHDANPGEQFPKLGVGLLSRPDAEPYSFMRDYPVERFPIEIECGPDAVEFRMAPLACRGYAAGLTRRLTVAGNELSVAYHLQNVGERTLVTHEYNHNFIAIDRHPVGPDYALTVGCDLPTGESAPKLEWRDGTGRWVGRQRDIFYTRCENPPTDMDPVWTLTHEPTGVWVSERTDRPWTMFALFGAEKAICPEAFIAIDLPAGESMRWMRTYTFGAGADLSGG